jgi:hypothetical protein
MTLSAALVDHQHDLSGLRVAQHVLVRVGQPFERERAIEHGPERASADRGEQVRGAALAARERFLRGSRKESKDDNAHAL